MLPAFQNYSLDRSVQKVLDFSLREPEWSTETLTPCHIFKHINYFNCWPTTFHFPGVPAFIKSYPFITFSPSFCI